MEYGWDILWFIVGVSLLVTVHEFGHFWVARKLGFKVLRFSVGFGKPLYKRVGAAPDYTEFVIAALPLGGYVRMLDERDGAVPPEDLPRAFASKPPWQRILVMLAGPAANILFAILVLWGVYWASGIVHMKAVVDKVVVGSPAATAGLKNGDELRSIDGEPILDQGDASLGLLDAISDDGRAVIEVRDAHGRDRTVTLAIADAEQRHKLTEPNELYRGLGFEYWFPPIPAVLGVVAPDGPAALAGLEVGDEIKAVDSTPVRNFNELAEYIRARPATSIELTVHRGGSDFVRRVTTTSESDNGRTIGRLHINPANVELSFPPEMRARTYPGPVGALTYAVGKSWQMTVAQGKFFVRMLTGNVSAKNISGFVSIARYAGDAAHAGLSDFLMLMVLLSLSLGFLNLLPIPILDGGQIVFQLAEWAKGRPLSDRTYMVGQQAGLLLLVLLMGVALFNDLSGHFGQ
ncbi:MAG TPA: RIP metalloprotease RseP [Steroidobacteraceae bacterium]|jgi:regulator of sigma E protease|nr:RIP metalloprotease RseP [Steroidobacteraceae bacterium]